MPLRDGDIDRPDDENYQEHFFLNATSKDAPQVVDRHVQPILDPMMVYSGCYCNVSVNFYAFNANGNRGVAAGLGNIQFVKDGDRLSGRASAEADFDALEDDEDVVQLTSQSYGINADEQEGILKYLIAGGDLSLYGLSNAIGATTEGYLPMLRRRGCGYDKTPSGRTGRRLQQSGIYQ